MINFSDTPISEFYTYRSARVAPILTIECDEYMCSVIRSYIEDNGYRHDNHICWKSGGLCFMYSDRHLYVGDEIIKTNW